MRHTGSGAADHLAPACGVPIIAVWADLAMGPAPDHGKQDPFGMLMYRLLCAGFLAWVASWALSRPEAAGLVHRIPEMRVLGPIAAGYVGGFSLAVRQGWGSIVAVANGVWAGLLAIVASGVLYLAVAMARAMAAREITSFPSFFEVFGDTLDLLLSRLGNLQLVSLWLAAAAAAGLLTEGVHWLMVRMRERRQRSN